MFIYTYFLIVLHIFLRQQLYGKIQLILLIIQIKKTKLMFYIVFKKCISY